MNITDIRQIPLLMSLQSQRERVSHCSQIVTVPRFSNLSVMDLISRFFNNGSAGCEGETGLVGPAYLQLVKVYAVSMPSNLKSLPYIFNFLPQVDMKQVYTGFSEC